MDQNPDCGRTLGLRPYQVRRKASLFKKSYVNLFSFTLLFYMGYFFKHERELHIGVKFSFCSKAPSIYKRDRVSNDPLKILQYHG